MGPGLNLDDIFPMKDAASATLMRRKADCLRHAGVIGDAERLRVYARSALLLVPEIRERPRAAEIEPSTLAMV
jgi:hypothetical protein